MTEFVSFLPLMTGTSPLLAGKLVALGILSVFLPLSAITYYKFRRHRRLAEVDRIFRLLKIDRGYQDAIQKELTGTYFIWTVAYASLISVLGLAVLLLFKDFPQTNLGTDDFPFPAKGSRLVMGMAFLGAYLWGLQYIFRRYGANDLVPGAYYVLSIRIVLAGVTAFVLYNASSALPGLQAGSGGGIPANVWPALALLLGMFPQQGLRWMTDRLPMFGPRQDSSVAPAPLDMIEGLSAHDKVRLEEEGLDTCYDLATHDFVPLILKTPFPAREVVDWMLQAKLIIYFGSGIRELRAHSIRTILDLETLTEEDVNDLTAETSVTKSALERARKIMQEDAEIRRLRDVGMKLGRFTQEPQEPKAAAAAE